tara:strand:+ start:215 stop:400 length:186 start_codon:yes stop_codon:yes gene_type:complete
VHGRNFKLRVPEILENLTSIFQTQPDPTVREGLEIVYTFIVIHRYQHMPIKGTEEIIKIIQ